MSNKITRKSWRKSSTVIRESCFWIALVVIPNTSFASGGIYVFLIHRSYRLRTHDLQFVLNSITVDSWCSWVFVAQLVKIKVWPQLLACFWIALVVIPNTSFASGGICVFLIHRSYRVTTHDLQFVLNSITVDSWCSWVFVAQLVKIKVWPQFLPVSELPWLSFRTRALRVEESVFFWFIALTE